MSTTIDYDYNYVFDLASRLSPTDQDRLLREMNVSRKQAKEPIQPVQETDVSDEKHEPEKKEIKWVKYTVPGEPMVSREEIEAIKRRVDSRPLSRTPEELEKNRKELLEILLNCPVMTEEELKGYEEARKELNECRLAYL